MKFRTRLIVVVIILIIIMGYSRKNKLSVNSPSYISVTSAKEDMKSLIYGSHGWWVAHSYNSSYIYAVYGNLLIRYHIADNTVDKVVNMGDMPDFYTDRAISFSLMETMRSSSMQW